MPRFLVVLDADSTLLEDEVIELLADRAGTRAAVAAITARAMRGDLDFAESLRERVATLAGLRTGIFDEVRASVRVTRGADRLARAVQQAGGSVGVVSGGFHEILDPVASQLGLDHCAANRLEVVDGRLTGSVTGPIIDAQAKADTLNAWAVADRIPLGRTVAIGDGANDLRMMAIAGLSVAFDAKPRVRETADVVLPDRDLAAALAVLGL